MTSVIILKQISHWKPLSALLLGLINRIFVDGEIPIVWMLQNRCMVLKPIIFLFLANRSILLPFWEVTFSSEIVAC